MLIEYRKPKTLNSSYALLTASEDIGRLMSKIQSAIISLGYELEHYITENCPIDGIEFKKRIVIEGQKQRIEPDFFYDDGSTIHIGEFKLGCIFDTKKSRAEIDNLYKLKRKFENEGREVEIYFCSYMAQNEMDITDGLKGLATDDMNLLYGRVFFDWFNIDYNAFQENLSAKQKANLDYIFKTIDEIKLKIETLKFL